MTTENKKPSPFEDPKNMEYVKIILEEKMEDELAEFIYNLIKNNYVAYYEHLYKYWDDLEPIGTFGPLELVMEIFEKKEEYEKCQFIKDTINRTKIVIRTTNLGFLLYSKQKKHD